MKKIRKIRILDLCCQIGKSWLKVTYPLLIAASLDTFYLVAPQR